MERSFELENFRKKLMDRYITLRTVYGIKMSFDELWLDFLARHFMSDQVPTETVYECMCDELEQRY